RERHGRDRRVMQDVVAPLHGATARLGTQYAAADEADAVPHRRQVFAAACRQIIERDDLVIVRYETFHEVRPDEAGAAGDEIAHAVLLGTNRASSRPDSCR